MLKALVTGGRGHVGTAVRGLLSDLSLTWTDRAELDVTDVAALRRAVIDHPQVLHLAAPFRSDGISPQTLAVSIQMVDNILAASIQSGVERVILMSSIQATCCYELQGPPLWTVDSSPPPRTPYGLTRLSIEEKARQATLQGLEVVCVRLGGLNRPDVPARTPPRRRHWISYEDAAAMLHACLTAPIVPGRYTSFYAVSDLPERILDTRNPFGWTPATKSVGLRRHARHQIVRIKCAISTLLGRTPR